MKTSRLFSQFSTLLSVLLFSACCTTNVAPPGRAFQTWYGRVNNWTDVTVTQKDLPACHKYGVDGYMIEMAGWKHNPDEQWTQPWINETAQSYKRLVKACRKNGLWLFVSIVNDNMGLHKDGDKQPHLEKVIPQAQQLAQIIKKFGPRNVIVQPVAETQTPAGEDFQRYCINYLKGFTLVYNGQVGFPSDTIAGMPFMAVHPAFMDTPIPQGALAISDNGSIIKQLAINHSGDGKGNPALLVQWATHVKACRALVAGYYAYRCHDFDEEAIKALGSVK
jgi:hypothetical protein